MLVTLRFGLLTHSWRWLLARTAGNGGNDKRGGEQ